MRKRTRVSMGVRIRKRMRTRMKARKKGKIPSEAAMSKKRT